MKFMLQLMNLNNPQDIILPFVFAFIHLSQSNQANLNLCLIRFLLWIIIDHSTFYSNDS